MSSSQIPQERPQRPCRAEKLQVVAEKVKEAEAARDGLSAVLKALGIVLPSLRIVPLSCVEESPRQLLDLGPCALSTARSITAALEYATSAPAKD